MPDMIDDLHLKLFNESDRTRQYTLRAYVFCSNTPKFDCEIEPPSCIYTVCSPSTILKSDVYSGFGRKVPALETDHDCTVVLKLDGASCSFSKLGF